ncbi:Gfo/Idh/MocA family protein [Jiangella rhizosphaerae]|uniref:Gfo/Idh/MocA family oxidoreductase n=1 Tax=Jiangella rhizosphaerae TaxID=2293569 RepID=A0A418KNI3_9ACTN|nr:Gfo/Idh/MocA family oxidoreductase [Jiangella rhizosphaerae]RIQ20492.1 gfo/Idh/MocA family oxidoreductase [Jiangella rhizosphaerae]
MNRTRVGIVGAGFMGSVHAAAWAACPQARLTAIVGGSTHPPARLAEEYAMKACADLDELLDLVDLVDICVPTDRHHEVTVRAARAGRAVVCEKPLARTPGEAADMIAVCREAGVPLLPAHVVRFFPEYAAAKAAVDAGVIGEPAVVRLTRATFQPAKPAGNWYLDEARSGGLPLDLMVHDLDYARWIAGDVESVYARSVRAARPDAATDHVLAILRHSSGAISHVEASWAYPPPTFRTRGEVAGSGGVLEFDSDRSAPVRPILRAGTGSGEMPLPSSPLAESPYAVQLRHLLDVVRGAAAPIVTAEDALAAVRIAAAVGRSIASGRPANVEEVA